MMQQWHNLQPREQRTLLLGALVALPLLIYALFVDPFAQELERLRQGVADNRELLAWMEQSASRVKASRSSGAAGSRQGGSLLSLVDSSAKKNGLGGALKQVTPEGKGVRLRLEQAGFDEMVRWLGWLGGERGVAVSSLTLERLAGSGLVNATVVLEAGGE